MIKQLFHATSMTLLVCSSSYAQLQPTIFVDSNLLPVSATTQTASVDVWVQGNGATPVDLAGFQLTISLSGPDTLVQFVGFGAPATHPYLFDPTSTLPGGLVAGDGLSIELGDFLDLGVAALDDGDGLASLLLEVQPGAMGSYQIEVSVEPTESFLAESLTEFVSFGVQDGEVTVTAIVPEPGAMGLAVLGIVCSLQAIARYRVKKEISD